MYIPMNSNFQKKLVERFLKYVEIDTKSDPNSETVPSTAKQLNLAKPLKEEMIAIGLSDVTLDDKGYLMGKLPANIDKDIPKIGLVAHMDTSPDFSGENVKPLIWESYDGKDLVLNKEENIVMETSAFPELNNYVGQTLITTDGTTLLGADNKAGIAEIMTAIEYLVQNPDIKHGELRVGFTPDEEVGRGADHFDVKEFDADFAYTIDGGEIGELEYENFNAAGAKVILNGRNIHPGNAKNKMKNAVLMAMEFNAMLPASEVPGSTEGYEGFFHLNDFNGTVESAEMLYIIRDHDLNRFNERKALMESAADYINKKYGQGTLVLELTDQYFNMKEKVEPVIHIVETAKEAMEKVGVVPKQKAIRGGTDGARLSYMGLPTPNIFTGGHNFHGRFEYIPVESMVKSVETVIKLVELYASK